MISLPQLSQPADAAPFDWGLERIENEPLVDGCGRRIDHLRLSVTSACDLRCRYCRPGAVVNEAPRGMSLNDSQRLEMVRFLYERHGLRQLRITGGEPLLHRGVVSLLRSIRSEAPRLGIAMTTNAQRLAAVASELRRAGLDRVNISLDTLNPATYLELTGSSIDPVLEGIDAAVSAGFPPPRVNTVALSSVNRDELPELATWAIERGCEIRFLEAMPIGPAADFNRRNFISANEIRQSLERKFRLALLPRSPGETAMRYVASNGSIEGTVGIIAPVTEQFCTQCRRIRITAQGMLYPCLLDSRCVDLKPAWGGGVLNERQFGWFLHQAVSDKQPAGSMRQVASMMTLGG